MDQSPPPRSRRLAYLPRFRPRSAARARPATGFAVPPEPRGIGRQSRGRQLLAGNFLFAGVLTTAPGGTVWDAMGEPDRLLPELHGFGWLDDLAAVGDLRARTAAQAWTDAWLTRSVEGDGAGWAPDLVGRRLIRLVSNGAMLTRGADRAMTGRYFASLGRQVDHLSRHWGTARSGIARIEALAGLIYAVCLLRGLAVRPEPALAAMVKTCRATIGPDGGIPTRNPEELLRTLVLLQWAETGLDAAGIERPAALTNAAYRIATTLRGLRHADGGLARFHGGGRGADGALDQALALAGPPAPMRLAPRMGFARLVAGRTSLIADAAPPPKGAASAEGHASTLAFELTSGRRQLIVNCGAGAPFGPDWRRAGRATPSHSTLVLAGYSSSRLAPARRVDGRVIEELIDPPEDVQGLVSRQPDSLRAEMSHDGFRPTHGLTHARTLEMSLDGRGVTGEDLLTTLSDADKAVFSRVAAGAELPVAIRFHLHPDVEARVDLGGAAVSLTLKSGEIWVFRHDGTATLSLAPSVYLETGRLKPRAAQQVVLSHAALSYATRIRWSLTKAQDTPDVIRDLEWPDDTDEEDD